MRVFFICMSPSFKQTATFDVVRGNVYCVKTVSLFCVFFFIFLFLQGWTTILISGKATTLLEILELNLPPCWKEQCAKSSRQMATKKKSPSLYQCVNVLLFPVNCDLADPFSPLCYCWHRVAGREREELSRAFPEFREAEGYAYKSQRHTRQKMARGPHSSTRATGRYIYSSSRLNQTRKRAPTSA